jgi:hypothetical protein
MIVPDTHINAMIIISVKYNCSQHSWRSSRIVPKIKMEEAKNVTPTQEAIRLSNENPDIKCSEGCLRGKNETSVYLRERFS